MYCEGLFILAIVIHNSQPVQKFVFSVVTNGSRKRTHRNNESDDGQTLKAMASRAASHRTHDQSTSWFVPTKTTN
jgi:hypothetical protein